MVQSVSRALDLLEALAAEDEFGLMELAEEVGQQPSTAHRLLGTLVERGYVVRRPGSTSYALGFKALQLSGAVRDRTGRLRSLAAPRLKTIQRLTEETANLSVLEERQVTYIDQVAATRMVRIFTQVGRRAPAHATGSGKAMLAFRSDEDLKRLYGEGGLERQTAHTIGDLEELRGALAEVRRRGYAVDDEEQEEGVSCVAAPILDDAGDVCGALSVSGLTTRLMRNEAADLGELLKGQARELSEDLGWRQAAHITSSSGVSSDTRTASRNWAASAP